MDAGSRCDRALNDWIGVWSRRQRAYAFGGSCAPAVSLRRSL